jgi:hypothetical protein
MEKKLFRVKVVLYVMAENESEACVAATKARFDIFECVARKAETVDPDWNDAIPYNADEGLTCSEILGSHKQTFRPETHIVNPPPYVEGAYRSFTSINQIFLQG